MKDTTRPQTMDIDREWFEKNLTERFIRYARVHTTSDHHSATCPSTECQWDLARLLVRELQAIGVSDTVLTEYGYVIGRIPPSPGCESAAPIAFLAHMDTSPESPGLGVEPQIWNSYDGGPIIVGNGVVLDPETNPELARYTGETIITSGGNTLLGADDKAGIAEILCACEYLAAHSECVHGPLEIVFTPDEEIGRGVDRLNIEDLSSRFAYTLAGSTEGTYNDRCFNAYTIDVTFTGRMIHPGTARGILVNAVAMAGMFVSSLPRNESPEATDGPYGFYCPQEIGGTMDTVTFRLFIRDFDGGEIERRLAYLRTLAETVEGAFPGGKVTVDSRQQYLNLEPFLSREPKLLSALVRGIEETGIPAVREAIRGGTDGARLSERGLPTPNIFTGGHNYHSTSEWIGLPAMVRAAKVVINIAGIWTEK